MARRFQRPAEAPVTMGLSRASEPVSDHGRLAQAVVLGLAAAGIVPPLVFAAFPGDLGRIGAIPLSVALVGLLILAPALAGLVTALVGLDAVRDSVRVRGDKEHEQAILRVLIGAAMLAYSFAAGAFGIDAAASCRIVASLVLAVAWIFLALAIIDPAPSLLRQCLTAATDAALLSAYLHFGDAAAAPWFPLYLLLTCHAGFRLGLVPLAAAATASVAGFGVTVAMTDFWRDQPFLSAGLVAALVVLPGYIGAMARVVATSRGKAMAAEAARARSLGVITRALRAPLDAVIRGGEIPAPAAQALLARINNILDFSAIEAGIMVPTVEPFDLHAVLNDTIAQRRAEAAGKGGKLRLRIDPRVPYRLRGWPRQLGQIVDCLVERALGVGGAGMVRVVVDAPDPVLGGTIRLRLAVHDEGPPVAAAQLDALFDPFAAAPEGGPGRATPEPAEAGGAFGLGLARRLVQLVGGEIRLVGEGGPGGSFEIVLPLSVDGSAADGALDLHCCDVLIATEDSQFASDLAEPLNAWHGDPRWIEGFDAAELVSRRNAPAPTVLIVDGRHHKLAALSFAHRAVTGAAAPAFVLFVADAAQIAGVIELAEGELDNVLPAPLSDRLLANALHALPLPEVSAAEDEPAPAPAAPRASRKRAPPEPAIAELSELRVTPISSHPRFAADAPTLDARAAARLRDLGGADDFLGEVVDCFRDEAGVILHRLDAAFAAGDDGAFVDELRALRISAANLGATRLNEFLSSLHDIGSEDIAASGGDIVQRLVDEVDRLTAALADFLPQRADARF